MQRYGLPEVYFEVFHKNSSPPWLVARKDRLETRWKSNNWGKKLITRIMKACNLSFPPQVLERGITVTIYKRSRKKHGSLLGSITPTEPTRISLYVRNGDTYKSLLSTLCHELIHGLLWSRYYFDNRRRPISFLADAFADELLTTLMEEAIMKRDFQKIDFEWALDYARDETCQRLKNLKRSEEDYAEVLKEIKSYFKQSRQAIRLGSNALRERERALCEISSPLPLSVDRDRAQ
jgi:hypothetical protein